MSRRSPAAETQALGPNHETLPPAEHEYKQTHLTDQRSWTSYDNKPHTNTQTQLTTNS